MPIIDFPKGPMATPEAYPIDEPEEPDIGVADVATNVAKIDKTIDEISSMFYCDDCGSSVFNLYDDGEVQCANPRCGIVLSDLIVSEINK